MAATLQCLQSPMTNQKSPKESRMPSVIPPHSGFRQELFPHLCVPGISCISHRSVDSLLTFSSSHLRGGEQCSVPLMCNKVTSTQHLPRKKKNQCISNLGPWHIRSSRKRAGNGIFKESNVLEENKLLNPPSYCPVPNSKKFISVFSAVTPLKIK